MVTITNNFILFVPPKLIQCKHFPFSYLRLRARAWSLAFFYPRKRFSYCTELALFIPYLPPWLSSCNIFTPFCTRLYMYIECIFISYTQIATFLSHSPSDLVRKSNVLAILSSRRRVLATWKRRSTENTVVSIYFIVHYLLLIIIFVIKQKKKWDSTLVIH